MATQRKTPARGKAAATHKKGAAVRPARAPSKPARAAKPKAHPVVAAKPKTPAVPRVIGRPAVKGRPLLDAKGKPALDAKGKPVVDAKGRPVVTVKGKPKLAVAKRTFAPTVRPLGVLPPEMRVASVARPPLAAPARAPVGTVRAIKDVAKTPSVQRVTEKDHKEFEERLLVERRKIMKEMGHLETTVLKVNPRDSAGDLSGYSFHMADAGTDAMEREKSFLLASAEGRILMEINEALRRLYRSEFGECEICSQPIGRARLEAMPYTRLCLSCKEKEERAGRGAQ